MAKDYTKITPLDDNVKDEMMLPILVGPTGSGKTAVAVELCQVLGGEIISVDSMQVYRGLDIGTAKATPEEQALARHHLIDIINPNEEYSAARWANDVRRVIDNIRARGKQPIIVGGTGFYLTALLFPERLASAPPNPLLREQLEEFARREGSEILYKRLQSLDAKAATRLHPNDTRRVIRAIEVARHEAPNDISDADETSTIAFQAFGLSLPREVLYERINTRVDAMLEAGFMDELRSMIAAGYGDTPALQSLGYKQMRPALNDPEYSSEGVELWKRDTRRYAKRQMTWFRHQLPVQWIAAHDKSPRQIAEEIVSYLSL